MSIPIYCPKCVEIVGIINDDEIMALFGRYDNSHIKCTGKENHPTPVKEFRTRSKWFGLLKVQETRIFFPETLTYSWWARI